MYAPLGTIFFLGGNIRKLKLFDNLASLEKLNTKHKTKYSAK
jgi:hypothetical protein